MVSDWKAGSKITHYNFGSYPLDTVVRAKALALAPDAQHSPANCFENA